MNTDDLAPDEKVALQTILAREAARVIDEADEALGHATTPAAKLRMNVSYDLVQLSKVQRLLEWAGLPSEALKVQDHFTRISAALALAIGAKNESRPHAVEAAP